METTPVSLLERLHRSGAQADWERFVELYTPLLYFWACRQGLQAQDAADLVQEVFTTLVTKMAEFRYDPQKSFRAWLKTVALNQWRDSCRRKAAALKGASDRGLAEAAVPDPAQQLWETEFHQHLVGRALQLMQAEFKPGTWKACWEVVVAGRSVTEVATQFKASPAAVYAAKYRVLRRLRQELAGMLE